MAKKTKSVQTKVLPVPFIDLKSMGVIRDGKARVAFGYGRIAAKPEYPISSLAIPMINDLCRLINYRDKEHCDEDIATLKAYVDRLEFEPPKA